MKTSRLIAIVCILGSLTSVTHAGQITIDATTGDLSAQTYDLTALGADDWKIWANASLTPSELKNGGTGIGSLAFSTAVATTLNSWTSSNNPNYSWSDGTNTASQTSVDPKTLGTAGFLGNNVGDKFTLLLDAVAGECTAYLVGGTYRSSMRLTASLSDGTTTPVTSLLPASSGSSSVIYTITYTSDSYDDVLTLEWEKIGVFVSAPNGFFTLQSAAVDIAKIPEPCTLSVCILGVSGLVMRRRYKTTQC